MRYDDGIEELPDPTPGLTRRDDFVHRLYLLKYKAVEAARMTTERSELYQRNKRPVRVRCDGVEYESLGEASRMTGVFPSSIRESIEKKRLAKGKLFEKVEAA